MRASATPVTPPAVLNSGLSMGRRNYRSSWQTWGESLFPLLSVSKSDLIQEGHIRSRCLELSRFKNQEKKCLKGFSSDVYVHM